MNQPAIIRASSAAALLCLAAGCGSSGSSPTNPTPTPTPSPAQLDVGRLNMELLARVDVPTLTGRNGATCAGNWGYTSPDGRRFALTTTSIGLSVVEVTDPRRPRNVALIEGPESVIKEVKSFRQYLYVTSEADNHGIDIIDMGDPDRPVKVQTWRGEELTNAHTLWIDERRGLLFANGARDRTVSSVGGMYVLDLARNPRNPRMAGKFNQFQGGFYIHDSYLRGNILFSAAIFDGFVAMLDVSDPAFIRRVGWFDTGCRFPHNAWPTDDGRYLFTTDERPNCPVETWDISGATPVKVSQFIATAFGTPHNVLVDGSRLLVSHYTEGLHLLDITDPTRLEVLGRFDTTPDNRFRGCWSAYPFAGSDVIVASDIDGGLFVLEYTGP